MDPAGTIHLCVTQQAGLHTYNHPPAITPALPRGHPHSGTPGHTCAGDARDPATSCHCGTQQRTHWEQTLPTAMHGAALLPLALLPTRRLMPFAHHMQSYLAPCGRGGGHVPPHDAAAGRCCCGPCRWQRPWFPCRVLCLCPPRPAQLQHTTDGCARAHPAAIIAPALL